MKKKREVVRCSGNFSRRIKTNERPKKMIVAIVINSPAISSPKKPSANVIIM